MTSSAERALRRLAPLLAAVPLAAFSLLGAVATKPISCEGPYCATDGVDGSLREMIVFVAALILVGIGVLASVIGRTRLGWCFLGISFLALIGAVQVRCWHSAMRRGRTGGRLLNVLVMPVGGGVCIVDGAAATNRSCSVGYEGAAHDSAGACTGADGAAGHCAPTWRLQGPFDSDSDLHNEPFHPGLTHSKLPCGVIALS